ncbi:LysE family translocator [Psychrobacter sp. I-STPA10]|uniref:LysE family translocator n=1 Tax=Psychrobacter sp. I-STPA10 TaxID=2585769 RepID=UPI001E2A4CBA|nr:LysE family transporter [Psychrobacter sp. I-STPA10]
MDFWQGFLVITSVHLLAAASPGPDFVLVSQQTLTKGRRIGLWTSFGITLGLGVHVIYSVLGLAAVIAHSQPLLTAIKYLGGAYLMYLGWQGIRSQPKQIEDIKIETTPTELVGSAEPLKDTSQNHQSSHHSSQSIMTYIRRGFLCNVFNPKAPIYFVAIFTLVLSPDMPTWQLAVYGVWMMVLQMAWFSTVVMMLSIPAINRRFQKSAHWVDRVLGGAMMALGLNLILRKV